MLAINLCNKFNVYKVTVDYHYHDDEHDKNALSNYLLEWCISVISKNDTPLIISEDALGTFLMFVI